MIEQRFLNVGRVFGKPACRERIGGPANRPPLRDRMTTPPTSNTAPTVTDRGDTIIDWFRIRGRYLTIGAAIVVVAGLGYWFYTRSAQIKAGRAEQSLLQAKQAGPRDTIPGPERPSNVQRRYGARGLHRLGFFWRSCLWKRGSTKVSTSSGLSLQVGCEARDEDSALIEIAPCRGQAGLRLASYQEAPIGRFDGSRAFTRPEARALLALGASRREEDWKSGLAPWLRRSAPARCARDWSPASCRSKRAAPRLSLTLGITYPRPRV